MDADADSVGYFVNEGQDLFELVGVGSFEGIGAGGDEVVRVLEGSDGDVLFGQFGVNQSLAERQYYRAGDGFSLGYLAG